MLSAKVKIKTGILISFLILVLCACQEHSGNISPNFSKAYVEMRAITEIYGTRPEANLLNKSILEKYGFTIESFSEEFEKLQKNYSMWNAFQTEVLSYVDTLQKTKSKEPR